MTAEEPNPPAPFPEKEGGAEPKPEGAGDAPSGSLSPPSFPGKGAGGLGSSRRRKFALVAAFVLVAFGVWYFAIRTPEPKDDLGRFQGEWQVVVSAGDRENKPTGRAVPVTVRVTGDRWVYVPNGKEAGRFALTLRPDADPKEIDLVMLGPDDKPNGMVTHGIYTVSRDRAKVVTAPTGEPRPATLDSEDATTWLLERVK